MRGWNHGYGVCLGLLPSVSPVGVLQCVDVCCSELQCIAVCCSVLQCVIVCVCCSAVQCDAVCCSVL